MPVQGPVRCARGGTWMRGPSRWYEQRGARRGTRGLGSGREAPLDRSHDGAGHRDRRWRHHRDHPCGTPVRARGLYTADGTRCKARRRDGAVCGCARRVGHVGNGRHERHDGHQPGADGDIRQDSRVSASGDCFFHGRCHGRRVCGCGRGSAMRQMCARMGKG